MKNRAEGATALPKTAMRVKGRNGEIALASHHRQSGVKK
jgi:hypothetical protein